jgi:hypothetical protein
MHVRPETQIPVCLLSAVLVAGCVGKIAGSAITAGKSSDPGPASASGEPGGAPRTHVGNDAAEEADAAAIDLRSTPAAGPDGGASTPQAEGGATQPPVKTESGLPASTTLAQLTPADKLTFCEWGTRLAGGLGSNVACDGGRTVSLPWSTINTCIRAIPPDCKATVAETETCAKAVVASPCSEDIPGPCKTLAACVLDRFFADGGVLPDRAPPAEERPAPELPACSSGSTMAEIETNVFQPKCGACHGAVKILSKLDLVSPGVAARVLGAMTDSTSTGQCQGRVLMAPGDPLGSLFVDKVANEKPACGARMPVGAVAVEQGVIDCVKRWAVLASEAR